MGHWVLTRVTHLQFKRILRINMGTFFVVCPIVLISADLVVTDNPCLAKLPNLATSPVKLHLRVTEKSPLIICSLPFTFTLFWPADNLGILTQQFSFSMKNCVYYLMNLLTLLQTILIVLTPQGLLLNFPLIECRFLSWLHKCCYVIYAIASSGWRQLLS